MRAIFLSAALLLGAAAIGGEVAERKMVWAHHTPWHTPQNTSLSAVNYYNFPLCDSSGNELEDWKREIAQAQAQGIDGFFPDLVARSGGATAFVDAMHTMLKAAEGSDFQIGACLDVKTAVDQQVRELAAMLDRFGNHPNYPRWNGRPVVNFYTFTSWTPEELAAIRDGVKKRGHEIFVVGNMGMAYERHEAAFFRPYLPVVDMLYSFGLDELNGRPMAEKTELYEALAAEGGKPRMSTVYPGYYGAWLNGRNDFYQVHDGFGHAQRTFELARSPRSLWMHYTTWNDHDETSIMPMVFTPGNVPVTKAYSDAFKGVPAEAGAPEVVFAYHREELPGTLLRFEAMTLPRREAGPVRVSGRLIGADGKTAAQLPEKTLDGALFDRQEFLVPSAALAVSPFLIPEFTISADGFEKTVRLPEVLLFGGWHQNAVTVKVAASGVADAEGALEVVEKAGFPYAVASFRSETPLKRVTLWRNDRPIAAFSPESNRKMVLNVRISGDRNFTVAPENGAIVCAVRKFGENGSKEFRWDAKSLSSSRNFSWTPAALTLAGSPDMKLRISVDGGEALLISAAELAKREKVHFEGVTVESLPVDATVQNRAALGVKEGTFELGLFSRAAHSSDRYQLRMEDADGKAAWTVPVYPFASDTRPLAVKVVETATTLETPSGATGCKGHNEYLSDNVPFRVPAVRAASVSPLSIRGGHWDFEGDGRDRLGDMPVEIPEPMFVPGMAGKGRALAFDGKSGVKMRLRSFPVGAMTLDLLLNPDSGRREVQDIVTRSGWSEAVELRLLPDGRLQARRSGNEEFKAETFTSRGRIPDGRWSRVRVTCDNAVLRFYLDGKPDSEYPVAVGRSYGNCTWSLGRGYTGKLDDLTVLGEAFAPGDPGEPAPVPTELFRPVGAVPEADRSKSVTGKWCYPAGKGPVLTLGPGPNTVKCRAEDVTLQEGEMLTVPLLRFDRAEPRHAWYALLVSISNGQGKSVNFNFGSDDSVMISANEPEWKIKTGNFKLKLPVELKIAKRGGRVFFIVGEKVLYAAADDPAAPYEALEFSTSSPDRRDAAVVELGTPTVAPLL